jgi:ankyrin repeat domain-containing protein 50
VLTFLHVGQPEDYDHCLKFRKALDVTNPEDDLGSIRRNKGDGVKDTCKWLLTVPEYQAWASRWDVRLLLLTGDPGIGKTMISSFLVDELKRQSSAITLAYYFCDNKDGRRNTAISILRSLLWQILKEKPMLFKHAKDDYDEMKDKLSELVKNLDTLWRIFQNILEDHDSKDIIVLVDALDECESSSRRGFSYIS